MRVCPKCGKNYFQSERFCAVDGGATEEVPDSSDPRSMIGARLGAYKITSLLGEGGMGMVFRAEHQTIGREVALKVLHEELAGKKDVVERFFTEAKAVNRIKHENIIEITDFDTTEAGKSYFVMELLEGKALAQVLQEEGPFDFGRSVRIGAQIADALAAAHKHEIVHRDLKPENVFLITRSGMRDFVKLLDFGIAKLTGDKALSKTRTGMIIGTPAYMSPEQAQGEAIDGRTDMYAWGIILYEMVCGRPPFGGENVSKILLAHVGTPPPPPHQFRPDVPKPLEDLILKCLSKEREDRYANMIEARAALVKAAEGLPDVRMTGPIVPTGTGGMPHVMMPTPAPGYSPLPGTPGTGLGGGPTGTYPGHDSTVPDRPRTSPGAGAPAPTPAPVGALGASGTGTGPGVGSGASAAAGTGTIPPTSGTPYPAAERKGGGAAKFVVAALVVVVFGGIGTGGVLYFNGVEPVKSALDGIFGGSGSSGKGGKKSSSGVVKLKSEPPGATVVLEGDKPKELGTTPLETKLPTGKFVKVTFRLRGYHDKSETVDPENDYDIKAVLERDPSVDTSEPGTAVVVHTGGPEPDTAAPHHDTAGPDTGVVEPAPPDGMTYVAGGHFRRGRDGAKDPYEGPAYDFAVTPFFLDLFEVSNLDYAEYAARTGLKKLPTGWKAGKPPAGAEALPVTNVTWDEARAYCLERGARLPVEAEWEFAAKAGAEDRVYPWGDDFDATRVNGKASGAKGAMAITSLRSGAAASGPLHMAGNVWEWTDSPVEIYPGSKAKKVGDDMRAIRGGSWDSPADKLTTTARIWGGKGLRDGLLGFRCAKDL